MLLLRLAQGRLRLVDGVLAAFALLLPGHLFLGFLALAALPLPLFRPLKWSFYLSSFFERLVASVVPDLLLAMPCVPVAELDLFMLLSGLGPISCLPNA